MKQSSISGYRVVALAVFLTLAMTLSAFAGEKSDHAAIGEWLKSADKNLTVALKGDNEGLKESAIQVVAELKAVYPEFEFRKVVIPLMSILRNHDNKNIRILAALSLWELGNEYGRYAVKEAATMDNNPMVRHICTSLVVNKSSETTSGFAVLE